MDAQCRAYARAQVEKGALLEAENARLRAALECAMKTLQQISATPRNRGAKRNAYATLLFIETQMEAYEIERGAR